MSSSRSKKQPAPDGDSIASRTRGRKPRESKPPAAQQPVVRGRKRNPRPATTPSTTIAANVKREKGSSKQLNSDVSPIEAKLESESVRKRTKSEPRFDSLETIPTATTTSIDVKLPKSEPTADGEIDSNDPAYVPTENMSDGEGNVDAKPTKKKVVKRQKVEPKELSAEDEQRMYAKAKLIHDKLCEIYPEAPKGFLDHTDAYTLLVAVVLSAQCTDIKVNAVTPALFAEAPNPQAMKDLGIPRIKELISSIGLTNNKSRFLYKLSEAILEKHDGEVPRTLEELEALPGVGHKTASVVASQYFGLHTFPVDTHIHRLACRWGIGDGKSVDRTEAALKRWFADSSSWQHLHTRIIKFGREWCPATRHDMEACPICCFAATNEAKRANRATTRKFIAAPSHADPYAVVLDPCGAPIGPTVTS